MYCNGRQYDTIFRLLGLRARSIHTKTPLDATFKLTKQSQSLIRSCTSSCRAERGVLVCWLFYILVALESHWNSPPTSPSVIALIFRVILHPQASNKLAEASFCTGTIIPWQAKWNQKDRCDRYHRYHRQRRNQQCNQRSQ